MRTAEETAALAEEARAVAEQTTAEVSLQPDGRDVHVEPFEHDPNTLIIYDDDTVVGNLPVLYGTGVAVLAVVRAYRRGVVAGARRGRATLQDQLRDLLGVPRPEAREG